jgi:hypothetical protein
VVEVTPFGVAQNRRKDDAYRGATTRSCGPVEGLGTPQTPSKSSLSAETYYYHGLLARLLYDRHGEGGRFSDAHCSACRGRRSHGRCIGFLRPFGKDFFKPRQVSGYVSC